jgi:general secretion pathway protein G
MRNRVNRAFTLVEILIVVVILGILAAIVIPQFTSASDEAQVGNVQTQLQTIRSQIELFRVRNNGNEPVIDGAEDASFSDLLCGEGNTHGLADWNSYNVTTQVTQKPYMRDFPVNPRNKLNAVSIVANPRTAAAAADPTTTAFGWYYDDTTGEFAAVGFDEETNKWFGQ